MQSVSSAASRAIPARARSPGFILAAGLFFTVVSTAYVRRSADAEDRRRFQNAAAGEQLGVVVRLDSHLALLRAGSALFAVRDSVGAEEFRVYVDRLRLRDRYPALIGIGYAPRITAAHRVQLEEAMRRQGATDFAVRPAGEREEYFPITFLEPVTEQNQRAVGFDLYSEGQRRVAMARARDSGQAVTTGRIVLTQDPPRTAGPAALLVLPLYRGGFIPPAVEERRRQLIGFLYTGFRAEELLSGITGAQHEDRVDLQVYDGTAADTAALLFDSRRASAVTPPGYHARFSDTTRIDIPGRRWTLVFTTHPAFARSAGFALAPLLLIGGVLSSIALFGVSRAQARARAQAERNAADLRQSEAAVQASERRFRTLVEQSPLSTQLLAPDGRTVQVNGAWEALWGLRAADVIGREVFVDPVLERAGVLPFIRRALLGDAVTVPALHYELTQGAFPARALWVRAFVYPVHDDAGRVRDVVVLHEDVTEQRRQEEALRHTQKLESIGVLAGGIAHDFNNLLTGIMGNTSLALRALTPESPSRAMLQDAVLGCQRAAGLTSQLLAYAGKGRFFITSLDLCHLVRELATLLDTSIPKKVTLHLELGSCSQPVKGDASQLQQLLMNLVINAAEAIGDEPGHVTVLVGRVAIDREAAQREFPGFELAGGWYAEVLVRDTGSGMDEETRMRIFDPFFTTKFTGRGLGLAAALGIVRGHHGGIAVDSAPGAGSCFRVVVPLVAAADEVRQPVEPTAAVGPGSVLVAEDDPVVRHLARHALEAAGLIVLEAEHGLAAIEIFRRAPDAFGAVLLDLTMPVLGGEETIVHLRRIRPDIPVVVMSGYGETETRRRFSGSQITAVLAKPFTPDELVRAVRAATVLVR